MWVHSTAGSLYFLNNPGGGTDPVRMWTSLHRAGCSLFLEFPFGIIPSFFLHVTLLGTEQVTHIARSSSRHWKAVVKSPRAETPQNRQVTCWTLDLHPRLRSTAAASLWSTLSRAVWPSNGPMPPVAFPWPSNSTYFYAKSYSYEYHLQKWTRILVCSSGYPAACVKVIFGLAKRAGICYVCTWTVLMRT